MSWGKYQKNVAYTASPAIGGQTMKQNFEAPGGGGTTLKGIENSSFSQGDQTPLQAM